jgi:hypothetical protein
VASCEVLCVSVPKCCFDALELLSLNLSRPRPIPEPLYLSSQSNIAHLFKSSVDHSPGFVGRLEDLEVVVAKCTAIVKGGAWLWFCMEVAMVEWFVVAHGSFDIQVLSDKAVSYPVAYLGRLIFALVDEEDFRHHGVSTIHIDRPPEVLHDLFFV